MMTHDEVQSAIERLETMPDTNAVVSLTGKSGWLNCEVRPLLIDLLKQADPDTHMILPVDADGVPIHIGDELCGYGRPDGGVYCKAINGYMVFVGEDGEYKPKQWMVWGPNNCRHRHKPTIKELLRMFLSESEDAARKGYGSVPDEIYEEYVKRIREAMVDD